MLSFSHEVYVEMTKNEAIKSPSQKREYLADIKTEQTNIATAIQKAFDSLPAPTSDHSTADLRACYLQANAGNRCKVGEALPDQQIQQIQKDLLKSFLDTTSQPAPGTFKLDPSDVTADSSQSDDVLTITIKKQ